MKSNHFIQQKMLLKFKIYFKDLPRILLVELSGLLAEAHFLAVPPAPHLALQEQTIRVNIESAKQSDSKTHSHPLRKLHTRMITSFTSFTLTLTCILGSFGFFIYICAECDLGTILHTKRKSDFSVAAFLSFVPVHKFNARASTNS